MNRRAKVVPIRPDRKPPRKATRKTVIVAPGPRLSQSRALVIFKPEARQTFQNSRRYRELIELAKHMMKRGKGNMEIEAWAMMLTNIADRQYRRR